MSIDEQICQMLTFVFLAGVFPVGAVEVKVRLSYLQLTTVKHSLNELLNVF